MRLIDADEFINDARDRYCKDCDKRKGIKSGKWRIIYEIGDVPCRACDVDDMVNDIESAPTITPDMAQVLAYECGKAEQKRGRWIHDGYDIPHGVDWMHCSVCGRREPHVPAAMTNFCPNCGSDMRGENNG